MYDPNYDPKTIFAGLEFTIEDIENDEDLRNDLNELGSAPESAKRFRCWNLFSDR